MKQSEQLKKIMKATNCERYDMNDFYAVCPFYQEDIKGKSRLAPIVRWRQVGLVWGRLCGMTMHDISKEFNRDHSTVVHSEKMVANSLERFGDKWMEDILYQVINQARSYDANVNEAVSAVLINNRLSKMA
jgi:chromosomal replication initiation ATPase DnaA